MEERIQVKVCKRKSDPGSSFQHISGHLQPFIYAMRSQAGPDQQHDQVRAIFSCLFHGSCKGCRIRSNRVY